MATKYKSKLVFDIYEEPQVFSGRLFVDCEINAKSRIDFFDCNFVNCKIESRGILLHSCKLEKTDINIHGAISVGPITLSDPHKNMNIDMKSELAQMPTDEAARIWDNTIKQVGKHEQHILQQMLWSINDRTKKQFGADTTKKIALAVVFSSIANVRGANT